MANRLIKVLLIEDNPGDALLIADMLASAKGARFHLESVDRLAKGIERLGLGGIDAVLLDLSLPDSDGLDTFHRVQSRAAAVPIVILTGLDDEETALRAVQEGAQDYISKNGLVSGLLVRSLSYAIERQRVEDQLRDVTEKKLVEETQRKSEEKYRALFEESKDALFFCTPEGKLVDVNAAAVELFGFSSKEEMLSRSSMDLYCDPRERDALVRIGTQQGLVRDHPVELRRKDGKKLQVLVTAFLTRDENGKIGLVRGMLRDVTLQKQLEEELRHAQKMEAIGRLAGGVAHDFNNLLTVIQTSTFFAKKSLDPSHPLQASLREIEMAGKRAGDLTRQLLAFARRQVIAPRNVDLNELILDVEKMLRRLIGEDVELVTGTAPDLGLVRVDPGQMEQVLVNLSLNARDAMPQGGRLIIETSRVSLSAEEARRYLLPTFGDYALLTVTDDGCGMSAEVKARAFEPFFTTKELGKGTGLGLATCYGIVAQSGGQITAESEPGLGTTFRIYLPRFEGEAEGLPRANGDGDLPHGTETVLLVEDEAAVRNLVARVLRETGYTVLEAANGYEALRVAKSRSETPIRLVVSDVVMPEMGGTQAADQLRAAMPDVRVLFMSGYTDSAVVHYAERNQGAAFLQKPFTPEALAHKVREVLDGGAYDQSHDR